MLGDPSTPLIQGPGDKDPHPSSSHFCPPPPQAPPSILWSFLGDGRMGSHALAATGCSLGLESAIYGSQWGGPQSKLQCPTGANSRCLINIRPPWAGPVWWKPKKMVILRL